MSQEKKTSVKKTTKKKKLDSATAIIIAGLIIIAIPFLALGYILLSDSMKTGTPITGNRFVNDLEPAITEKDLTSVEEAVKGITNVEAADVILKTATLRVYVDTTDTLDNELIQKISLEAYQKVVDILDEGTYFTQLGTKKMYDLEIHTYNLTEERDSDSFSYVITSKSSAMEEPISQIVSEPKDKDLVQQIYDEIEEKNNPKPEGEDVTVGGQDEENTEGDGE